MHKIATAVSAAALAVGISGAASADCVPGHDTTAQNATMDTTLRLAQSGSGSDIRGRSPQGEGTSPTDPSVDQGEGNPPGAEKSHPGSNVQGGDSGATNRGPRSDQGEGKSTGSGAGHDPGSTVQGKEKGASGQYPRPEADQGEGKDPGSGAGR